MGAPFQTREKFIQKAVSKFGTTFDYSNVVYVNFKTCVIIKCVEHQTNFSVTPTAFLSGTGCPICCAHGRSCKQSHTNEIFTAKAIEVHGEKYDYSNVQYKNNRSIVRIACAAHGEFRQKAGNHLTGKGCRKCASYGYNATKCGFLYVMTCGDVVKVGITNRNPTHRARRVSLSYGANFSVVKSWRWDDGQIAPKLEAEILSELRAAYASPPTKFDGWTECFVGVPVSLVASRIEQAVQERIHNGN